MASATRADLLHTLPPARRSQGKGGLTTAADLRGFLAAMLAADGPAAAPAEALPTPQLQIRSFSASHPGGEATPPGVGRLASPGGRPTAADGPISTSNYLRLSFGAPLPAAVRAAQPELWLFTYHNRRRRPSPAGGLLRQAGWGHPCPTPARHKGAFWGGANPYGAPTEFYGEALRLGLAQSRPSADIVIDANHWFQAQPGQPLRPHGKKGRVRRFRFALVVNAPAEAPMHSGKCLGPLSDEVWLSVNPQYGTTTCAFHAPVYNHLYAA
jgi:hypothetical protein